MAGISKSQAPRTLQVACCLARATNGANCPSKCALFLEVEEWPYMPGVVTASS